ncbi:MAG: tRNA pseudouridine(38-40) synthase TruA [Candidatus Zixiibacteriota bacterium]
MRYRLDIAYHGGGFHGWQKQPGPRTVQGELELWLARLVGVAEPLAVTGAGRTDAGVHAEQMVAHFDCEATLECDILLDRLKAALPDDMAALALGPAPPDFHARYSALRKTYEYRLATEKSPFDRDRVWHAPRPFDLRTAQAAAATVLGRHDFSGFCRAGSLRENNTCRVTLSSWESLGAEYRFRITADRFLHEMVRLLVGTMVQIARGGSPVGLMQEIIERRDVTLCGNAAPPHGLTLIAVEYPPAFPPGDNFG